MAVPVFLDEVLIGVVGGCGLLSRDGEVDTFLIQKTIGGDEELLIELSEEITGISKDRLEFCCEFLEKRVALIIQDQREVIPN